MGDFAGALNLDAELSERIAVLRRYRQMLELQRSRLQDYLNLLDTREAALKRSDFDGLETYTLLEQQVIKGIMDVQHCIDPLADMYIRLIPEGSQDIDELQLRLENLRQKVMLRNAEGRAILKQHMSALKTEIDSLRIPYNASSVYVRAAAPQMVDIKG